jgi:hypothetical protein
MVIQVLTLMPLRTTMNYQVRAVIWGANRGDGGGSWCQYTRGRSRFWTLVHPSRAYSHGIISGGPWQASLQQL